VWRELYGWSRSIEPKLPAEVEINTIMYRDEAMSRDGPVISLLATAYADDEGHARDVLSLFETCPVRDRAMVAEVGGRTTLGELTSFGTITHYPTDKRFIADNMWTHATFAELEPGLKSIQQAFPPAPSHLVWFPWTLTPERPPMAYSLEDDLYLALYGAWDDASDDKKYTNFVTERMRAMEPVSTGVQLADENLINRPRPFLSDANYRRLDSIRAALDPDGMFASWLGWPAAP
jgi:hypothetical protein